MAFQSQELQQNLWQTWKRNLIRVAPDPPHVNFQLLVFAKHPPALSGSIGFF